MKSYNDIPEDIRGRVHAQAAGPHQSDLLYGHHRWSGAGLKGKARQYGASYARHRQNLLERIQATLKLVGWKAETAIMGEKRTRELVLTDPAGTVYIW